MVELRIYLILEEVSVLKTQLSVILTCSIIALLGEFVVWHTRYTLYCFEFCAIHLILKFLVSCTYYKMWQLLTLKVIFHLSNYSEIFLKSSWRLLL